MRWSGRRGAIPTLMLEDTRVLMRLEADLPSGTRLWAGVTRRDRFPGRRALLQLAGRDAFRGRGRGRSRPFMTRCVWCHLVKAIRFQLITGLFGFTTLSMNAPYYTPGPGPDTLQVGGVPAFAPLICYEVIFPALCAAAETTGPPFLLNVLQ